LEGLRLYPSQDLQGLDLAGIAGATVEPKKLFGLMDSSLAIHCLADACVMKNRGPEKSME
jgi:hypothetical protein